MKQECIRVGCIPSAAVVVLGAGVSARACLSRGVSLQGVFLPRGCLPKGGLHREGCLSWWVSVQGLCVCLSRGVCVCPGGCLSVQRRVCVCPGGCVDRILETCLSREPCAQLK